MKARLTLILVLVAALGCSAKKDPDPQTKDSNKPALPVVSDARTDLVLSWFSDGGAGVASSVKDIPAEARGEVRVQDPTILPEKRDPKWIFFADLTKPDDRGNYPVRKELRAKYEAKRHKAAPIASAPSSTQAGQKVMGPSPAGGSAEVTMYATRHCPVCHKARRWLLEQKIPYIERDLETDTQAAMELAKKGQAQGVPTNGVPIFEIRGQLVPGFDPPAILRILRASGAV